MKIFSAIGRGTFFWVLAFGVMAGPALHAQTSNLEALQASADAGDLASSRSLGAMQVFETNGATQDVEAGIARLQTAASGGDIEAKAILGKILIDGYFVEADLEKGEQLLSEAAEAGHAGASAALGAALLWGKPLKADPDRAHQLLGAAAQKGNKDAMRVLGLQLIGGWILEKDEAAGRALLEQAVAAGDVASKVELGSLLLYGTGADRDEKRALALFEEAAKAGNGQGLQNYGESLLWDHKTAAAGEEYLRRAGELGQGAAWSTLAEGAMYGYLGKRSRFDSFADMARAAGDEQIAVLEANRQMWGISMRASGPETIETLEEAAENGNVTALKFLVGLTRDGNQYNVRKRPEQARGYIEKYADLLTPKELEQLNMTIEVATHKQDKDFPTLAAKIEARPDMMSSWFAHEIFAASPNLVIYMLQTRMKNDGKYDGPLHGLASKRTLHALWHECVDLMGKEQCGDEVLNPKNIAALLVN